ncbi:MAG: PAS domain-containing protein [Rhodobacteraceae bacterium]|nr:PAS domain-containing protein [Paracoccaceae bacterium]
MSTDTIRATLEALPWPVIAIGPDERMIAANGPAAELIGHGLVGRHFITALRQPDLLDCIETTLKQAKPANGRYLTTQARRDVTFLVRSRPLLMDGGQGALVSFEDVTPLQQAGQMRRDFVANVSHELRTPLTALSGFIETLRTSARDDPAARERFLGIMERETARMGRLVRDLLSLSRVEVDERVRPVGTIKINDILKGSIQSLESLAAERGATITFEPDETAADIPGDGDQLAQVFVNLIENAIKYGRGQVTISVSQSENEPSLRGPAVRIDVQDNGEGIGEEHLPRLTERFYRVDSHRSREMGGTGLGLAIVKHIVNRHRGRLRISSEPDRGSRFSVILPIA